MRTVILYFLFLMAVWQPVRAAGSLEPAGIPLSHSDSAKFKVRSILPKKPLIAGGLILNTAGILFTGYKWWWQGNYHPFQMDYEGYFNNYSLGVDKTGHFYISHLYFHVIHDAMQWGGFSNKSVMWTSVGMPALYAVTIEIADGFTSYHFSWDDLGANFLGIGLGVLQKKSALASCFQVKWSYYPSAFSPWRSSSLSLSMITTDIFTG